MGFCGKCGTRIPEGDLAYCPKCGAETAVPRFAPGRGTGPG